MVWTNPITPDVVRIGMNSSSDLLRELANAVGTDHDPGFAVIVAFDYYDGPERGVALYSSGKGVRFSSLGDSKSRLFRAFELIPISGNWWSEVNALYQAYAIDPSQRVLVLTEPSDVLTRLERDVFSAPATGLYVGVGSPNLEHVCASAINEEQLDALRQLGCSPAAFQSVHRLVKGHAADM
jgi:hypothetical protein